MGFSSLLSTAQPHTTAHLQYTTQYATEENKRKFIYYSLFSSTETFVSDKLLGCTVVVSWTSVLQPHWCNNAFHFILCQNLFVEHCIILQSNV